MLTAADVWMSAFFESLTGAASLDHAPAQLAADAALIADAAVDQARMRGYMKEDADDQHR